MPKKKRKLQKNKSRGAVEFLILFIVITFGLFISGFFNKNTSPQGPVPIEGGGGGGAYSCCDSGDGDACKTNPDKKFMWKGTNSQPEEYQLLKSDIALAEGAGHIAEASPPDNLTPSGEKIFLNTTNVTYPNGYPSEYSPGSNNACKIPGQDFVFKKRSGLICQGIPNDEIIYVCKSNCGAGTGVGRFDAYYRVKDGAIPDVIKNCQKPTTGSSAADVTAQGKQRLVFPTGISGADNNLQLKKFDVVEEAPPQTPASWLSPYCKPAIYLYPTEEKLVSVKVDPLGPLTYTDPLYPKNGWNVKAFPNGNIFYQNKNYDYLYYETAIPDDKIEKPKEGYIVDKNIIGPALRNMLSVLGLNKKESDEFVSYWTEVLPDSPYYFIGVVPTTNLDAIAPLNIAPKPDTVIRITLYFEALDKKTEVTPPYLTPVDRTGFTVVEWGGIFKKDKNHPFSCFM